MDDPQLPAYYNDIDATREQALDLIARGVKDRRSGFHTFTVATSVHDGPPSLRTVVNRGFDMATRTLRFHTDQRSTKLAEIAANPNVAVHMYDAKQKVQMRLKALATAHQSGDLHEGAWAATRDFSRECYRVMRAPGDVIDDPSDLAFAANDKPEEGVQNFAAVTLHIQSLEWLYLAHQGHRRALFAWNDDMTMQQNWLVP
ncbi:MAG: pyridoxamine 5'-phosphate oxidase family protein [Devosiaceae bacterium]